MKSICVRVKSATGVLVLALLMAALVACDQTPDTRQASTPAPSPAPIATPSPVAIEPEPTRAPEPVPTAAPAAVTPTPAPTPEVEPESGPPLPFDPTVVRGTLANGLTYYVKHNAEPRNRAQLSLVVNAGSIDEENDQRGLAHFVEHMAFNGTERFAKQEIVEYLESVGGTFGPDINASTYFDETRYWIEIPTDDPEIAETAFQILSDWAFGISFAPDEVELERGVVLEEWRVSQGFESRIQDTLLSLIFGSSRYAQRVPIGLTTVIENAPVQRLRDYYESWYRPDRMALIAVGDFDPVVIESKIVEHFSPPPAGQATQELAAGGTATQRPQYEIPSHGNARVEVFTDPESPGTQFILVRNVAPQVAPDLPSFRKRVVEQLAFMMLNARLFERAQVENPPYLWAAAGRSPYVQPLDILTFSSWTEQGGVERGFGAVLEEMHRVRQHGFTATELAREKANLRRAVESAYAERDQIPSRSLADEYIEHFFRGVPAPGVEYEWELYQELLPQIELTEFDDLGASWTQLADAGLLVVRPTTRESPSDADLAATLLAQLESGNSLELEPYDDSAGDAPLLASIPAAGSITGEERIESIDVVRWTLSNGITVMAKQTDFRNDEVVFSSFSPGGHSLAADEDHFSAIYSDLLVSGSGVGPHDSVALDKLLAGKRVSVAPYIGELFEGFNGSASPQDLETLFQLISLYATQPRLDPAYYDQIQGRMYSVAEFRAADPDAILADRVSNVLSQNHLRARPLTADLIEELSPDRVERVYAERFADLGDSTFVFVGAFDWDELRSLVATYLASLPGSGESEQWRDVGIDPPSGIQDHTVRAGLEPRAATVLVFAGQAEFTRNEALALSVAGEMLGTRLREEVREALGGTYHVQVTASRDRLPDPEFLVSINFGSDPERAEELLAAVFEEIAWLRAGGEADYLDTVREQLLSSREEQLRENGFWLRQVLNSSRQGDSFALITDFEERLAALTTDDIAAVATRVLPLDSYVRVLLLPESQ